jgi:hypothetical protein
MSRPERIVYLSPLDVGAASEEDLRFRLTYEGPLQARQGDARQGQHDKMAPHIHSIRREFNHQLRRLWDTNRYLKEMTVWRDQPDRPGFLHDGVGQYGADPADCVALAEYVASKYQINGYRFVPLVRESLELSCDLGILFLRMDPPGSVITAGDIDNRIKSLIDALRLPKGTQEFAAAPTPLSGEDPFFVLLEDDKCVTGLSIETDTLLAPPPGGDQRSVKLVIEVTLRPYVGTDLNLGFV